MSVVSMVLVVSLVPVVSIVSVVSTVSMVSLVPLVSMVSVVSVVSISLGMVCYCTRTQNVNREGASLDFPRRRRTEAHPWSPLSQTL